MIYVTGSAGPGLVTIPNTWLVKVSDVLWQDLWRDIEFLVETFKTWFQQQQVYLMESFILNLLYKWQILSVCLCAYKSTSSKDRYVKPIYSESACLREGFKTVYELQYSIFFTWEVFNVFFADFFSHQKTLNTSHVKNIEANVKQNGLKPSLKHTDSEYIWFDICIFATYWLISGQTDRICHPARHTGKEIRQNK